MPRGGGRLRPLGFLLLMGGFGLRLDTEWQRLALALLACGAVMAAAGLEALRRRPETAFVSAPGRE